MSYAIGPGYRNSWGSWTKRFSGSQRAVQVQGSVVILDGNDGIVVEPMATGMSGLAWLAGEWNLRRRWGSRMLFMVPLKQR